MRHTRIFLSPLSRWRCLDCCATHEPDKGKQNERTDGRRYNGRQNGVIADDECTAKQRAAYECADDADDHVTDEPEAVSFVEFSGQPAGNEADKQKGEKRSGRHTIGREKEE